MKCLKQLLHKSFAFAGFHLGPHGTLLPLLGLTGRAQNGSLSVPLNILSLKREKQKVSVQRDSLSTSLCNFSNLANLRTRPFKMHTRPLTKSLPLYHSAVPCVAPCCLKVNMHTHTKICLWVLRLTHSMYCTILESSSGNSVTSFNCRLFFKHHSSTSFKTTLKKNH